MKMTAETNARLIAAAPDMLKALQMFVEWDEDIDMTEAERRHQCLAMGRIIRAAIAKAEGKS